MSIGTITKYWFYSMQLESEVVWLQLIRVISSANGSTFLTWSFFLFQLIQNYVTYHFTIDCFIQETNEEIDSLNKSSNDGLIKKIIAWK